MRTQLKKAIKNNVHVFIAEVGPSSKEYGRKTLLKVRLVDDGGNIVGYCDHINVATKPFKSYSLGETVRFTGEGYEYYRTDGTKDYSVKVNKVKKYKKASRKKSFCLGAKFLFAILSIFLTKISILRICALLA